MYVHWQKIEIPEIGLCANSSVEMVAQLENVGLSKISLFVHRSIWFELTFKEAFNYLRTVGVISDEREGI